MCITRKRSSTACFLPYRDPPGQRPPTETPLKEHRTRNRDPPKEHGTRQSDIQRPPSPWTEWLTRACENITLRQTSFAGGKNLESQSVEEEGFKGNHNILFYNPQARQSATPAHCKVWWPPWCDETASRFYGPVSERPISISVNGSYTCLHLSIASCVIVRLKSLFHFSSISVNEHLVSLSPKLYTVWLLYIRLFNYTFLKCATYCLIFSI